MDIRPTGSPASKIFIIQDCPREQELQRSEPLQGSDGMEFNRMLGDAKIMRSECFVTSLIRSRVPGNDASSLVALKKNQVTLEYVPFHHLHVLPRFLTDLEALIREIDLVKPRVILALGNASMFALTGKWGIKSWRGSSIPYTTPSGHSCTVVPTYSPDYVRVVWKERQICVSDMRRVKALAERPTVPTVDYNFLIRPSFTRTVSVLNELLRKVTDGPTRLSVDIETRAGHITCVGIAWSRVDAICIPQMVSQQVAGSNHYWREEEEVFITHLLYRLLTHPNAVVIGQNFLYDAQYFYRHFHFLPNLKRDTMIAHHSMFSNMRKSLDFLASMYCENYEYWKKIHKFEGKKDD